MKALAIDLIKAVSELQMRDGLRTETVEEYCDLFAEYESDWPFDKPLTVYHDGFNYWLADGFHRFEAAKQAGRASVKCEVINGTKDDAQDFAFSANHRNGLRRTNADKRRAVEIALCCKRHSKLSNRAIAELCQVSKHLVNAMRQVELNSTSTKTPAKTGGKSRDVVGRDGKTYSVPVSEPATDDEWEYVEKDEDEPLEEGEIDCGPVETDQTPPPSWADNDVGEIQQAVTQLKKRLNQISDRPGNELILKNAKRILLDLDNIRGVLKSSKPYAACPYCSGLGNDCECCGTRGWVDELTYQNAPEDLRNETSRLSN